MSLSLVSFYPWIEPILVVAKGRIHYQVSGSPASSSGPDTRVI